MPAHNTRGEDGVPRGTVESRGKLSCTDGIQHFACVLLKLVRDRHPITYGYTARVKQVGVLVVEVLPVGQSWRLNCCPCRHRTVRGVPFVRCFATFATGQVSRQAVSHLYHLTLIDVIEQVTKYRGMGFRNHRVPLCREKPGHQRTL